MAELPADDRIARHISKGRHKGEVADGATGIVDSVAFMPRPDYPPGNGLEQYLSVNWVECFSGSLEDRLSAVTADMSERIKGFDSQRSRLGILDVRTVHDAAALKPKQLSVRIIAQGCDAPHAGVYGMELDDVIIAQELARLVLLYRPRVATPVKDN